MSWHGRTWRDLVTDGLVILGVATIAHADGGFLLTALGAVELLTGLDLRYGRDV